MDFKFKSSRLNLLRIDPSGDLQ